MKIKVMVGSAEQTFDEVGSAIGVKKLENLVKALKEVPAYDESTGAGDRFEFSGYSLVFVKDELSGKTVPFIVKPGRTNPLMVTDVAVSGDTVSFTTNKDGSSVVDVKFDAATQAIVEKAQERFGKEYDTPEKKNELGLLYLANTKNGGNPAINPYADEYQSYIKYVVPVKKADSTEATLVVVRDDKDAAQVYYVPAKVERESTLVDEAGFAALGAELVHAIAEDATDTMKATIKLDSGDVEVSSAAVSGNNVVNELNQFQPTLGLGLVRAPGGAGPVAPESKMIPGGVNITYVAKGDKAKAKIPGCILVGPHAENESNKALYSVLGKSLEEVEALDLSHDEFMALVTRKDYGTAAFTETKNSDGSVETKVGAKDVSGISIVGVKDYVPYKNNDGQVFVRVLPRRHSLAGRLAKDYWGQHQYTALTVADPSITSIEEFTNKLDDLTAGKGGLGTDRQKPSKWLKVRVALKHAAITAVTLAIVLGLAIGIPLSQAKDKAAAAKDYAALQTYVATTADNLDSAALQAMKLAVKNLPDESKAATEAGIKAVKDAAKDIDIIGQQFADKSWQVNLDKVLAPTDNVYHQVNGLTYEVDAFAEGDTLVTIDGVEYKLSLDADGKLQTAKETRTLTEKEIVDNGGTYYYYEDHTGARFAEAGKMAAEQAVAKDKKVLVAGLGGKTEIVVTYDNDGTREAMVEKYEKLYASTCGKGCGEFLVGCYEDAFIAAVKTAQAENKVGANAIENQEAILESDAVKAAAAAIAGENAVVLTVKDGYAYIRSEDESIVHRVAVGENLENLAEDLKSGKGTKKDTEMYRASDSYKNLFPGKNSSKYENTYVVLNKGPVNGKTVAAPDVIEVVAGDVEVRKGYTIEVVAGKGNNDEMIMLAIVGADIPVPNRGNYVVSAPETSETVDVTMIDDNHAFVVESDKGGNGK